MCTSIHPFDANCTSQAKIVQTERSCAYAERLCSLVPLPEAKVFYTNSGTEAVEAALKLARYVTGRPNILSFAGAFHGRTMGSLSVSTSKAAFRARHEPFLPGVLVAPYPRHELGPTLEAIDHLLAEQSLPDRIAAGIVELVLGEGGYVVPPDAFLPALRRLCDEHGIVLIVDEVQSGFGRTGRLFACQHTMVSPDLMALGKGIASGLPMGALVGRAGLLDAWAPGAHGTTFGGNPVACAAADATLHVLEGEGLIDNAARRGAAFLEGMKALARRFPDTLVEVRGRGLMIGLEFVSAGAAARFRQGVLSRRVIVSTCGPEGGVVRLAPPLIVDEEQTDRFLAAASDALATLAPIPLQGRVSPT